MINDALDFGKEASDYEDGQRLGCIQTPAFVAEATRLMATSADYAQARADYSRAKVAAAGLVSSAVGMVSLRDGNPVTQAYILMEAAILETQAGEYMEGDTFRPGPNQDWAGYITPDGGIIRRDMGDEYALTSSDGWFLFQRVFWSALERATSSSAEVRAMPMPGTGYGFDAWIARQPGTLAQAHVAWEILALRRATAELWWDVEHGDAAAHRAVEHATAAFHAEVAAGRLVRVARRETAEETEARLYPERIAGA